MKSRRTGVTLPEILVAMLIAGVLAAIALPTFLGMREQAKDQEAVEMALSAASTVEGQQSRSESVAPASIAQDEPSLPVPTAAAAAPASPFPASAGQLTYRESSATTTFYARSRTGRAVAVQTDRSDGRRTVWKSTATSGTVTNYVYDPSMSGPVGNLAWDINNTDASPSTRKVSSGCPSGSCLQLSYGADAAVIPSQAYVAVFAIPAPVTTTASTQGMPTANGETVRVSATLKVLSGTVTIARIGVYHFDCSAPPCTAINNLVYSRSWTDIEAGQTVRLSDAFTVNGVVAGSRLAPRINVYATPGQSAVVLIDDWVAVRTERDVQSFDGETFGSWTSGAFTSFPQAPL